MTGLAAMTWRKFQVLVRGLSPNSATVTRLRSDHYFGRKEKAEVLMDTPEKAEAAFVALFKTT